MPLQADAVTTDGQVSRLVMIEDQASYGDAFGAALSLTSDLELIARVADAESGIALVVDLRPDLVLADYRLAAGETGTQIAAQLRAGAYTRPVVLLTGFGAPQVRREAAEVDNVYVLSKNDSFADLVTGLRAILAGNPPPASVPSSGDKQGELSLGEQEVLEYLNTGMSPSEIASHLHLSIHTVRARIKTLHSKLNVHSQLALIVEATKRGLLVPPS